ncbi:MAG: peptide chain release factor 1 [Schleiferiaceae bacterium]|jgi:peptide chain release factor 1|nr:peptide chain release factor 1 [Schleiferiaceae bacterium]MDP4626682.1 peptide chain release factor 1 [Schleiferiaceae bacterium]MDP4728792.1 peptide chain release factor 1 [Schleiferiaceae bacterium]MDP4749315.1 peptide chain release factor 1 [Schleiferiaceae bacterium]MDP4859633.1 peptide chain release factor 1 [Schleiferiaceae bacterium]
MSFVDKLNALAQRFDEVNDLLMQPEVSADPPRAIRLNREYKTLLPVVEARAKYLRLLENETEARDLLQHEKDSELRSMAKEELDRLLPELEVLEAEIKQLLVPKDPEDAKNAVLEIRAGTGGDEAGLFAADLFRMYARYLDEKGWKYTVLSATEGTLGGYKEVSVEVSGEEVYGTLKYESGVHRVQRVPATESQGRVHTSAATVAVLPEADELDVQINDTDIRKDTFRSSGAGGQHVNKTESGVRLTHLPTNTVVECQDGRSQHQNYDQALKVLRARIWDAARAERDKAISEHRKSLVSTGDRSAKIRTYNYPQGRVTDHRIGFTLYNLPEVMNGQIHKFIEELQVAENAERLKEGTE